MKLPPQHPDKCRSLFSVALDVSHPVAPFDAECSVKQEFKDEVDINRIISNARRGIAPPAWMNQKIESYSEIFHEMPTNYGEAFELVEHAKTMFETLPLEMRRELDHDPRNLDQAPREMFEKYNLLKPRPDEGSGTPDPSAGRGTPSGSAAVKKPIKAPPGASKTPPLAQEENE